jgi:hypothetical protein
MLRPRICVRDLQNEVAWRSRTARNGYELKDEHAHDTTNLVRAWVCRLRHWDGSLRAQPDLWLGLVNDMQPEAILAVCVGVFIAVVGYNILAWLWP